MHAPIIDVDRLSKTYRVQKKEPGLAASLRGLFRRTYLDVRAVDEVSFTIDPGELIGFIGPNGAGKTTTLKMLAGLLHPTSGQVRVLGHEPFRRERAFQRRFSLVLGQKNQLWWDLPAIESFLLNKEIYGIPEAEFRATLDELVGLLELRPLLGVQVRKLSLGERMKCELAGALLHRPAVLFLDEPTIGLDVVMQQKLRDLIAAYNQGHRATILLTSHYMDDVKALCERVPYLVLSLAAAFLLSFLMKLVIGFLGFWLTDIGGLATLYEVAAYVLGGVLVPLELLPPWLQSVAAFLPFRYIYHVPLSLLLGRLEEAEIGMALIVQVGWVLALALLGGALWRRGLRRYEAVGG